MVCPALVCIDVQMYTIPAVVITMATSIMAIAARCNAFLFWVIFSVCGIVVFSVIEFSCRRLLYNLVSWVFLNELR